jgi:hypothetical protein
LTHYLTPLLKGQPADNLNALTARMNSAIKGNTTGNAHDDQRLAAHGGHR